MCRFPRWAFLGPANRSPSGVGRTNGFRLNPCEDTHRRNLTEYRVSVNGDFVQPAICFSSGSVVILLAIPPEGMKGAAVGDIFRPLTRNLEATVVLGPMELVVIKSSQRGQSGITESGRPFGDSRRMVRLGGR